MDRRQAKTRRAVFRAFTALLEKKTYSSITIQEIIDEADIGRSTFYAHFDTKEDLLQALCTEIFAHVFSEDLQKEKTHDFSVDHGMRGKVTHILYHMKDDRRYIRGILSSESGEVFMRYFKAHLRREFQLVLHGKTQDIPEDYLLNHMVCDFAESVRWWMQHPEYSPEELGGFIMATTPDLDAD